MAEKLEDWLNGEVKELSKMPVGELSNNFFFRDPIRPTYIDNEHFYSPADGTILYQKIVQQCEELLPSSTSKGSKVFMALYFL